MIRTESRMCMEHFHDFYFLQALQAAIHMKIAANPEQGFRPSVEKLQIDLHEYMDELYPNIALRSFVYLYAACLGESRHARSNNTEDRFLTATLKGHRSEIFSIVSEFAPTQKNLQALVDVFSQKWSSGFGGKAWMNIAEALLDFDKTPAAAWIDHIIDLEHNNGTAFNKEDARQTIHFEVEYPNGHFREFLNYKFEADILTTPMRNRYGSHELRVTRKTGNLMQRYCNIFREKFPFWVSPNLPSLKPYEVRWGDEEIRSEQKWMRYADVTRGNEPSVDVFMDASRIRETYPPEYSEKQLRQRVSKLKGAAKKSVRRWTAKFAKEVNAEIKKWLECAVKDCRIPKASKTYHVLPFTARCEKAQIVLSIPFPYENIGIKTETGFDVAVGQFRSTFEGVKTGWMSLQYGAIVVQLEQETFSFKSKELEAILD